jgi:hypothetical protein
VVIFGDALHYGFPMRFSTYPTLEQVAKLRPQDACFFGGCGLVIVAEGRWRLLGSLPNFDPREWPVPRVWWRTVKDMKQGFVSLGIPQIDSVKRVPVDQAVLDLDPHAGEVAKANHGAFSLECELSKAALERPVWQPDPAMTDLFQMPSAIVNAQRIAAWKAINEAIARAE